MTEHTRHFILVLAFFLISAFNGFAQKGKKEADALYNRFEFAQAVEAYKKIIESGEPTPIIAERIAHSYRFLNNAKEAEFWYAQTLAFPESDPVNLKYYAEATRKNGKYEKAKQLFLAFAEKVPAEAEAARKQAATCDNAQKWLAKPEPFEVKLLPVLRTENADFSPVYYQDGLVFTSEKPLDTKKETQVSTWTGRPNARLYFSKGSGLNLSAPVALPEPLNQDYQNGSATFSPDFNTIYFTRINRVKQKNKSINTDPMRWTRFVSAENYTNRLEIFISQKKDDKWSVPQAFAYNKVQDYSVGHPALSPDGNTLYFVSDMPGGHGQTDIYYCTKDEKGGWSQPVNAGKEINTPEKEMFPVVTPEGKLYFSSEGHNGMGGLDIYVAEGKEATWSAVQNLKSPLNSPQDDFGILFEKGNETGYLSSNRSNTDGTDDIFSFKYVRIPCNLAGRTIERVAIKPGVFQDAPVPKVMLRLYREGDTTSVVTYSDAKGNFTFPIVDGIKYTIRGSKPGYLTRSTTVTPDCQSTLDMIKMGMVLNRSTPDKPIILENIYYDLDKYEIRPDAALELDKLVQTLVDNPTIKIELSSHTDSRQNKSYNNLLSQLRAESAVKYIVSKGIDRMRMTAKGYGETRLLNKCADNVKCTETEHQLNRRTEFKILSK